MISPEELRRRLSGFPRLPLAHLPTPLEKLDTFSKRFEGLSLHMKRDDQTGLAFGGNKARKLEFIMADVVEQGADSVVTWAGVQSNWCRQVAASCARIGKRAVLVLLKRPGLPAEEDGNLLIDRVFNADVRIVESSGEKSSLEYENVQGVLDPILDEGGGRGQESLPGSHRWLPPGGLHASAPGCLGVCGRLRRAPGAGQGKGLHPRHRGSWLPVRPGTQAGLLAGCQASFTENPDRRNQCFRAHSCHLRIREEDRRRGSG